MTLIVFGRSTPIGIDIERQSGADAPFLFLDADRADPRDPEACASIITATRPGVVINASTIWDGADPDIAVVNGQTPGAMAAACAARRVPFIQLSNAEVFDASGEAAWRPDDATAPTTELGKSLAAGESAVRESGAIHAILRISWLVSLHGKGPVKAALEGGAEGPSDDIISAPTPSYDLARACMIAAERLLDDKSLSGTYHYQGAPHVTWPEVVHEIRTQVGRPVDETPPVRPETLRNHRLDCARTEANLGLRRPDWRKGISYILSDMGASR